MTEQLSEKCADCHLFVEPNDAAIVDGKLQEGIALMVHLHRGDDADEAIEATHEARASGMKATLSVWRAYGPELMRQRFYDDGGAHAQPV